MTQLFTVIVRTGLVAAVMVATVPIIAFAQTTEPAIEGEPAGHNLIDTPVQSDPVAGPAIPAAVELEIQRRFSELRHELLDDRAEYIDRWLFAITIFLALAGFMGFRRFREIEADASKSAELAAEQAKAAERHAEEAERGRDKVDTILQGVTAQTAADDPDKARQAVADVRENPKASPIDKAIADAVSLQQQGKSDEAIEKWRAIAQVLEGSDNSLAASAWFSVGYLLQDRDPQTSISVYNQALRLNPHDAEAYNNRGIAKAALGKHDDAIVDLDQALRLNPDFAEAYSNRGAAKAALGRHDDATADYDKAIHLKPDHADAYYNRGTAKRVLGRYEDAIADYDKAIHLNPAYAKAYGNRGLAKADLGRHEDAIADYEMVIQLEPNDGEAFRAYNLRGTAKAKLKQYDNAIADFGQAILLNPDYAVAYNNRGNAKRALGRYEDAIADYGKAICLNQDFAVAYINRGTTKATLDRKNEAQKDFETALELARSAGNEDIVTKVEQLLRNLDDDESP